jgi:flagellar basal body-associated protein FliL
VSADLRSALRAGARTGRSRTLPVAVLLVVLVILAAGIGGTSDFTGARWFPKLHGSYSPPQTAIPRGPTTRLQSGRHRPQHAGGSVPSWVIVIAVVLVAIALIALVWRWWRGRRLPSAPQHAGASVQTTQQVVAAEPEPEPEKLLTGIELALEVLDEEREPADAIVRAWLGLQETAEESGIVRRPAETPTEFTSRILSGAFADDRALRTLLRLYLRTRFGDHPVTATDVAEVRDALRRLVSSWQPTSSTAATRAR